MPFSGGIFSAQHAVREIQAGVQVPQCLVHRVKLAAVYLAGAGGDGKYRDRRLTEAY